MILNSIFYGVKNEIDIVPTSEHKKEHVYNAAHVNEKLKNNNAIKCVSTARERENPFTEDELTHDFLNSIFNGATCVPYSPNPTHIPAPYVSLRTIL